jgi:hypothetical protein
LHSVKKRLCSFQIGRIEAFGEAVVDRLEERHPLRGTALIAPESGEAVGGAQFPRQRRLLPCDFQSALQPRFGGLVGTRRVVPEQQLSIDAQEFRRVLQHLGRLRAGQRHGNAPQGQQIGDSMNGEEVHPRLHV